MYEINKKRLINTFTELVRIPSPSWHEKEVIEYITGYLKMLKIRYRKLKCGNSYNIYASTSGGGKGKTVLFSAHMDTVVPCENVEPLITDKRISSNGKTILGSDDKAAIAMFLEALHYLKENRIKFGPVELIFSCAEEVGLCGIKGFDMSLVKSRLAFIFDSGGRVGKIVLKAPYHSIIDIFLYGKAAHAGIEPEKGINAIKVLSEVISEIPGGRIDNETSVNVGIISGGRATNIVAEEAYCKLEVRSISNVKLKLIEKTIKEKLKMITARHGAKYGFKRNLEYNGFSIGKNDKISVITQEAMKKIGIKPEFEISGGGSDTNILNGAGIKAINLSCGMNKVHSCSEYILIKDLLKGTELVLSIIETVNE